MSKLFSFHQCKKPFWDSLRKFGEQPIAIDHGMLEVLLQTAENVTEDKKNRKVGVRFKI